VNVLPIPAILQLSVMKLVSRLSLLILLAASTASAQTVDTSSVCKTCKPCEDFYRYANEVWLSQNPIPPAYPIWGHWGVMRERNTQILHDILESAAKSSAPKGSIDQMIGDFYASGMDSVAMEKAGVTPLNDEIARIRAIKDKNDVIKEMAHLQRIGVETFFYFGVDIDPKKSDRNIAMAWQSGLGMPDREYYFKTDDRSAKLRDDYRAHMTRTFQLAGLTESLARSSVKRVYQLESLLAAHASKREDLRDPEANYHMKSLKDLDREFPALEWKNYFTALGSPQITEVMVAQPQFMTAVDSLLAQGEIESIKSYFEWKLYSFAAPYLSTAFVNEDFTWQQAVSGAKEMHALWKRRVRNTDNALGELLGQAYVRQAFTTDAKARMKELIANLRASLRDDIQGLKWIGDETRKKALEKLEAVNEKIGYPDKWRDYTGLEIDRGPYVKNVIRTNEHEFDRVMKKLGQPVSRDEWGMTPPTINAYYNSTLNEIVFPAGILQPPFFDAKQDDAFNYGAIGAIIGHELTHGFDDQGAKSDAKGNLTDWWTEADMKEFESRAKCIIDQFNAFTIEDTIHVNGEMVVGESIADLGGVKLAYNAYMRSLAGKKKETIGGFTPEQRFFIGYARAWATNARPEFERLLVSTDFHPLGKFRVLGPLSNFPEFGKAFNCKEGDPMMRPASERCDIW
jgi:putative endopeptidase